MIDHFKPHLHLKKTALDQDYTLSVLIPLPSTKGIDTFSINEAGSLCDEITLQVSSIDRSSEAPVEWQQILQGDEGKKIVVSVIEGTEEKGKSILHYEDADDKDF